MAAVGVKGLSYYVNDNALLWQPQVHLTCARHSPRTLYICPSHDSNVLKWLNVLLLQYCSVTELKWHCHCRWGHPQRGHD